MVSFLEDIPFVEEVLKNTDKKSKDGKRALDLYKEYYSKLKQSIYNLIETLNKNKDLPTEFLNTSFPITSFTQEFDLTIKEEFSLGFSGSIISNVITINENDCPERKNFSIAHELGHYFMHINKDDTKRIDFKGRGLSYYTEEEKKEEEDADNFAGELLMPNDLVIQLHSVLKNKYPTINPSELINILAKIFKVSRFAMIIKFRKLRLISPFLWIDLHG